MKIATSTAHIGNNVVKHCSNVLGQTLSDATRTARLQELGILSTCVKDFVHGYINIENDDLSTDDEILNWCFSEVSTDLTSAIWLLASGFYKASASSLRNALDIGVASLYFQMRENAHKGTGYNFFFSEWDKGVRDTPNWGEIKTILNAQKSIVAFKKSAKLDVVQSTYSVFTHLCGYTHTSAFDVNGAPVTAINLTGTAPAFDAEAFDRGCDMAIQTMAHIAMLWQVAYPEIAGTKPLGHKTTTFLSQLFPGPIGPLALAHT